MNLFLRYYIRHVLCGTLNVPLLFTYSITSLLFFWVDLFFDHSCYFFSLSLLKVIFPGGWGVGGRTINSYTVILSCIFTR